MEEREVKQATRTDNVRINAKKERTECSKLPQIVGFEEEYF
jgi:hypothetical protein